MGEKMNQAEKNWIKFGSNVHGIINNYLRGIFSAEAAMTAIIVNGFMKDIFYLPITEEAYEALSDALANGIETGKSINLTGLGGSIRNSKDPLPGVKPTTIKEWEKSREDTKDDTPRHISKTCQRRNRNDGSQKS